MVRVSILGCGWLGLPLAQAFLKQKMQVFGSTTTQEKLKTLHDLGIKPFHLQLPNITAGLKEFMQADWVVINFPPARRPDIQDFYFKQFEVLEQYLNEHSKIILVSSTSVYPNSNQMVQEPAAKNPSKESGKALLKIEQWMQRHFKNTTILRFGGLVGPKRNPAYFLLNKRAINNKIPASAPVNLIHQADCISIILKIVEKNILSQVFNACAPSHPTRQEFYTAAAKAVGQTPPKFTKQPATGYKLVNSSQLEQCLKYQFTHPDLLELAKLGF